MSVSYPITNYLKKDNVIGKMKTRVFLCCYNVSSIDNKTPYLVYLLYRDNTIEKKMLSFPYFMYDTMDEVDTVETFGNKQVASMLGDGIVDYKGWRECRGSVYLFYHLKNVQMPKHDRGASTNFIFTTIHEIVNTQQVFDAIIHTKTTGFFLENPKFCFVKDNGTKAPVPAVLYCTINSSYLPFALAIGFNDLDKNIEDSNKAEMLCNLRLRQYKDIPKINTGCVLRYITFLGETVHYRTSNAIDKVIDDGRLNDVDTIYIDGTFYIMDDADILSYQCT